MLECQVGIQSDTHARLAKSMLQRYGYPCRMQRQVTPTPAGCSYLLQVKGDCSSVAARLEEYGIPYVSLRNLRDAH